TFDFEGLADVADVEPRPPVPGPQRGVGGAVAGLHDRAAPHLVSAAPDREFVPPGADVGQAATAVPGAADGDFGFAVVVQDPLPPQVGDVVEFDDDLSGLAVDDRGAVGGASEVSHHASRGISSTDRCASGSMNSASTSAQIVYWVPQVSAMCSSGPAPGP